MAKNNLHVLHVIGRLNGSGGTPIKLLYQIKNASNDINYTVICMAEEGHLVPQFRACGVDVFNLDCSNPFDIRQLFQLIRIIRKVKPDVVHTHFARSNGYGRLAAVLTGCRIVTSEHGIKRNTKPYIYILDSILNLITDSHVSNSYATMVSSRQTIKLNRKNMKVIHNGVPDILNLIGPMEEKSLLAEFGLPENEMLILDVGSHIELRNHECLIEAVASIKHVLPPFKLVLIGDGPHRGQILKSIQENGVGDRVLLLGRVDRDKVHKIMQLADIYVNPAYAEGFGIATVEAMLLERPIIYCDAGSLPELLENNVSGLSYSPRNARELAEKILALVGSEKQRVSLAGQARTQALEKFSILRFVRDFEDLYRSILVRR